MESYFILSLALQCNTKRPPYTRRCKVLLFRSSIHGLCQPMCCYLSWGTAASHFPFSSPSFFWALTRPEGTLSFFLAQVHQRYLCVLTVWWKHGLLPSPRICSDCSVPSAVLLSASSPEFLRIAEAQSLPRSKISCDPVPLYRLS